MPYPDPAADVRMGRWEALVRVACALVGLSLIVGAAVVQPAIAVAAVGYLFIRVASDTGRQP